MLSRETWAEISLSTIQSNYEQTKKAINGREVMPVLKANAYGHGLENVGRLFDGMELPFLCVASLSEAYQLMEAGVRKDILVFSYVDPSFVMNNNRKQIIFTIPSLEWYQKVKGQARFHLEINSGMNRMGVKTVEDAKSIIGESNGDIEGIYTHFSDLVYDDRSKKQAERFISLFDSLDYEFNFVHAGNISIKLFNELDVFDSMRIGLGLFGYREDIDVRPTMELFSNVMYLSQIEKSESVGYDYAYDVEEDGIVASIPIGYADGFDKRQEKLDTWINDSQYPIVGGICMDQSMLLVDKTVKIGDKVEILGKNRSMYKICKSYGTSAYEVLVGIGPRVTRIYID